LRHLPIAAMQSPQTTILLGVLFLLRNPLFQGNRWISLTAPGLSVELYLRALCVHLRGYGVLAATLITATACAFAQTLLEVLFTITAALLFAPKE
jgi:hypothetical protein